jgi:hypothetical protein
MLEYFPHRGHDVEVLQAEPQGFRSWLAVGFAPEETTERRHCVFQLHVHLVFVTKYRYRIF